VLIDLHLSLGLREGFLAAIFLLGRLGLLDGVGVDHDSLGFFYLCLMNLRVRLCLAQNGEELARI
jgi:hypothetical protein